MSVITISLDTPSVSKSFTISGANLTRIINKAIADRAGSIVQTPAVPAVLNPDGSVKTPAVPAVMRDPTQVEAMQLKMSDWLQDMSNSAVQSEKQAASLAAANAVTPIVVT